MAGGVLGQDSLLSSRCISEVDAHVKMDMVCSSL
jgi:hypothetical protein